MIIDFRIRPPFKSFRETGLFKTWNNPPSSGAFALMAEGREPVISAKTGDYGQFMAELDEAGIDLGVIVGRFTKTDSVGSGNVTPEEILDFMNLYPGRFMGMPALDPTAPDALSQIRRMKSLGMKGICVEPFWLDKCYRVNDPCLMDFYRAVEAENLTLVITLNWLCGNDTSWNEPKDIEDIAIACPNLNIVVPHSCYPKLVEFMAIMVRYPNIYSLPDSYFYFPFINTVDDQILMYNHMLQDQVLFASSYPIRGVGQALRESLDRPWMPVPKEKFLWKNAAKLLGIDTASA